MNKKVVTRGDVARRYDININQLRWLEKTGKVRPSTIEADSFLIKIYGEEDLLFIKKHVREKKRKKRLSLSASHSRQ